MKIVTIHAIMRCKFGEAPKESLVNSMINELDSYAVVRNLNNFLSERQYWDNVSFTDDMQFGIFRDYVK